MAASSSTSTHGPLFFDDIAVGDTWKSGARTVTETDIVMFAGLTGDYNPLHVDEEFAKETFYGARIAHGLYGAALVAGVGEPRTADANRSVRPNP